MLEGALTPSWIRWGWPLGVGVAAATLGVLAGFDPKLAMLGALAGAFAFIAFSDLAIGLALFVFISFIGLHPFGLYDALARLILAVAWFAVIATRRRRELEFPSVHPVATALMLLFVIWSAVSVTWAEDTGEAFASTQRYGLSVLLLMIAFTAIQTRRDLAAILLAFVLGATAATLSGLVDPSGTDPTRLESSVLDANLLAAALVAGLALSVGAFAIQRHALVRLLLGASAVLMASGVALTTSRSALVALAFCLVGAIVLGGRWRVQIVAITIVLSGATYVYFAGFAPEEARERVTEPFRGEQRSLDGRSTIWTVAWRAYEDNPVLGVGSGNFPVASVHYLLEPGAERSADQILDDPKRKVAHNSYLSVLSELGIVGLVLFASIIVFAFSCVLRAARSFERSGSTELQAVALSVAIGLLGLLVVSFFQSDQQGKGLWLLLALGPALLAVAKGSRAEQPRQG